MVKTKGYTSKPLSLTRKTVIASVNANKQTAIHSITEVDVSEPRRMIRYIHEQGGTKYSFTAYLVKCLAETLKDHPELNSFIKGRRLVLLDDVTVSVLVERTIGDEKTPEPLAISSAGEKNLHQIHQEIREAQKKKGDELGSLSGAGWIRWIPSFLMQLFVKIADKNLAMAKRYGKVAVTAVGMYSKTATWFIPHGTATVLLTVGSISTKPVWQENEFVPREMLHITASFDHHIVDGAPAARFMKQYAELVENGSLLKEAKHPVD